MLLGILRDPGEAVAHGFDPIQGVDSLHDALAEFTNALPGGITEVATAILPIVVFSLVFELLTRRFKIRQLARIGVGLLYTAVGLLLFLTGVEVGFIPVGGFLGTMLADSAYKWLLVPVGALVGYFIVAAEPAVHVLVDQVEEISGGAVPKKVMNLYLSIGVSVSVGLAMLRVITGISLLWFLVPGYAVALFLTFKVPRIFTGIAFDSGGVASGPMTSTFLLPFVIGACEALDGNVMTDAFGVVAMVAMTPLITIQTLGYFYGRQARKAVLSTHDEAADQAALEALEHEIEDEILDGFADEMLIDLSEDYGTAGLDSSLGSELPFEEREVATGTDGDKNGKQSSE
jgi:hypothetical protein